ncbi:uncharacterized protein [Symphalangus syndactylus]|uniref:uncharacterized protein isoform X2 n=1 Tax=Symphalangus syndactylus TaxID=9590 RepID=UPI0030053943
MSEDDCLAEFRLPPGTSIFSLMTFNGLNEAHSHYGGLSGTVCKSSMYCLDSKSREAQDEMNQRYCFFPYPICLPGKSEMWMQEGSHLQTRK